MEVLGLNLYIKDKKASYYSELSPSIFLPEGRISYAIDTTSFKILKYNLFCCFAVLVVLTFSCMLIRKKLEQLKSTTCVIITHQELHSPFISAEPFK